MTDDSKTRELSEDEYRMLASGFEKWKRENEIKYGKFDPLNIFYISKYEARMISTWIAKNQYTLTSGHFELLLHFGKFLLPAKLMYHQNNQTYFMPADKGDNSREDTSTPVGHIQIDDVTVDFKLASEIMNKYHQAVDKYVHAGGCNHDFWLRFKIHSEIYYVFAGEELLETRNYK